MHKEASRRPERPLKRILNRFADRWRESANWHVSHRSNFLPRIRISSSDIKAVERVLFVKNHGFDLTLILVIRPARRTTFLQTNTNRFACHHGVLVHAPGWLSSQEVCIWYVGARSPQSSPLSPLSLSLDPSLSGGSHDTRDCTSQVWAANTSARTRTSTSSCCNGSWTRASHRALYPKRFPPAAVSHTDHKKGRLGLAVMSQIDKHSRRFWRTVCNRVTILESLPWCLQSDPASKAVHIQDWKEMRRWNQSTASRRRWFGFPTMPSLPKVWKHWGLEVLSGMRLPWLLHVKSQPKQSESLLRRWLFSPQRARWRQTPQLLAKAIRWSKSLFLLVLLLSTASVAFSVDRFLRNAEEKKCIESYSELETKMYDAIVAAMEQVLGSIDAFTFDAESYVNNSPNAWPFVTLLQFVKRASKFLQLTGMLQLTVVVYATGDQRSAWETYAQQNNQWVSLPSVKLLCAWVLTDFLGSRSQCNSNNSNGSNIRCYIWQRKHCETTE